MIDIDKHIYAIMEMVEKSRYNVLKSVNAELIQLYWNVGKYLSEKTLEAGGEKSFIDETSKRIKNQYPELKGFDRRNLYRMRQFYEAYKENEFVSAVMTQISWTNHMIILSSTKSKEEKEFYIGLCLREKYSARELKRQIESSYYERVTLSKSASLKTAENAPILDNYVLEFLNLPEIYSEKDLKNAIVQNLKSFILEIGKDFSFIGEEFRIQVGNSDFYIDLLFYHRILNCLVAFELKLGKFQPEYLGKMNFYLEVLDKEYKKQNENPAIGVILCTTKEEEVVEYAMNRNLSPTMISEYTIQLIDKNLLKKKLRDFQKLLETNEKRPEIQNHDLCL
ncbi:putative nuclease YhcG [Methanimicrococcus sp. At1]|uniref:Nuclease YhcG n=1 Tax=Methanimicrococcus hacksteinii TaxID=3028293 RepID=A0ABU3VPK4_9EURY|nr:PDDEXK nuclease domain-containing protein [Methanimicrococcus sp. At1]MDV0444835.1 putative nuclease YhcG [Methanimicrococcus sp. At1]